MRIAGTGIVSCYGNGTQPVVDALRAGREGITPLTRFSLPFQEDIKLNQIDPGYFPHTHAGIDTVIASALRQALANTAWAAGQTPIPDCALVLGSSGFLFIAETEYRRRPGGAPRLDTDGLRGAGCLTAKIARQRGITGPVITLSTACASSANALLVAADLIKRGQVKRALVIGIEGLSAVVLRGFYSLMLHDPAGCRPFDAARRGLQLGEAIASLLLEASDDAAPQADNAAADFLLGGANLCDIHHVTSAAPDGGAMRKAMAQALADTGVAPEQLVAIKAHGTGSPDSDMAEAAGMRALFGAALPPFTGLKRYLGHTLGACGAVETAVLLACLRAGFIPPTAGCNHPDPALRVRPLQVPLKSRPGCYLLNFFGFGGNYASLVIAHDA